MMERSGKRDEEELGNSDFGKLFWVRISEEFGAVIGKMSRKVLAVPPA